TDRRRSPKTSAGSASTPSLWCERSKWARLSVLSIQTIREQTDAVRQACADRQMDVPLDDILRLDVEYRGLLGQVEQLRAERNRASKEIGGAKDPDERQRLIDAQRAAGSRLDALEEQLRQSEAALKALLLQVPNLFDE